MTGGYLAGITSSSFSEVKYLSRIPERILTGPDSRGRRILCRYDPMLFALIYMRHHLKSNETGDRISFSDFHLDLCRSAVSWSRKNLGPAEVREAWVAPRGSGKSTWVFLILPAWALAFEHRRFIAAFADSGQQAQQHLASLKREFDNNENLRRDYSDLCKPAVRPGGATVSDNQALYQAKSGVAFMARGIDASTLGAKIGNNRPDLLLFDDIEPDASNYSVYQKTKRLKTIVNAVFPMNYSAVVTIAGTVTMAGSIVHDIVRQVTEPPSENRPTWPAEEGIKARYYPALYSGDEGEDRSLWPQRWPVEYLQSIRHTVSFALNMQNKPMSADGDFWTPEDFVYGDVTASKVLLQIDPAVTDKKTSDYYGVSVIAYDAAGKKCAVRYARQFKLPPAKLRDLVLRLLEQFPEIGAVRIETNQGGDTWRAILHDLPVRLLVVHESAPKAVRAAQLLNHYQRGKVTHAEPMPDLEQQMTSFPDVLNDDLLDSVGAGVRFFLDRKPVRSSAKSMEYAR